MLMFKVTGSLDSGSTAQPLIEISVMPAVNASMFHCGDWRTPTFTSCATRLRMDGSAS